MKCGSYTREEIRDGLAGKSGSDFYEAAKEMSERLGLSIGHIYRLAKGTGYRRRQRADRGKRRVNIPAEIQLFMRGLTAQADFSADHVIFVTARHFGLPNNFISIATYNKWLRQERVSRRLLKKDLRPYRSTEAAKSNGLHQYDTTVAEAFYINDDGSIGNEPGYERYKNKPGNRRPRLVLYSLIDDHSRVIFARFYVSENALNLLDFVFRAWSQKDDPRFPFYGIPECLYCDQGAPAKSAKFKNAEQKLGFRILKTTPSHATEFGSRKHGKVERTFGNGLLGELMKETKIFRYASIEELNASLWDWLIHINNKRSSTTGEVRFSRWLHGIGTLRCMPSEEMFKLLHYDRATPTVRGNLQFQLNGKVFQLPYRKPFINWVDAKIEAYWYPGHEEAVTVVYDFHEEEIKALAPIVDTALEYRRIETTDREKAIEQFKGVNYSSVNFPQMYKPQKDLPYLRRKGDMFDESKLAEKKVRKQNAMTGDDEWKPSFAPEHWLEFIPALIHLRNEGFFGEDKQITDADKVWLKGLFSGRAKISETELQDQLILARARRENEAAEA
jgi:hypothetical protein